MTQRFTDVNFAQDVIEASKTKPVLVDFFASWCGPCQMIAPIIDELAEELKDKAVVGKLSVETDQQTAGQYNVMSIPTLIVFKDGEVKETIMGLRAKEDLLELINKHI